MFFKCFSNSVHCTEDLSDANICLHKNKINFKPSILNNRWPSRKLIGLATFGKPRAYSAYIAGVFNSKISSAAFDSHANVSLVSDRNHVSDYKPISNFSIDGIAQITWSGNATTIDQVSEAIEDPSKHIIQGTSAAVPTSSNVDTHAETFNYADTTGPSDADYLRNKLSSLYLDSDAQGGGSASNGLDDTTYDINITGGSLTIANNVTYVTPETIGVVDKPIGSFTGARVVSGSLTMYLDTKANGSNSLLTDLAGATDLVTNVFDLRLFMGVAGAVDTDGEGMEADDFTAPGVEFNMPKAHLTVPTVEVGDLISASVEFAAHGTDLLTGDEMSVKYLGSTSHTQSGYAASGARALDA